MKTIDILNKNKSKKESKWLKDAEFRRQNSRWLLYSAMIALKVKQRMLQVGVTQVVLAQKLGCTQQHISMLLKGNTNLTLETISKLEDALDFNIIGESLNHPNSYIQYSVNAKPVYLNEPDSAEYITDKG